MGEHDKHCTVAPAACCPWLGACDCQCICDLIEIVRQDERALAYADLMALERLR
jgi:hypothetical protein